MKRPLLLTAATATVVVGAFCGVAAHAYASEPAQGHATVAVTPLVVPSGHQPASFAPALPSRPLAAGEVAVPPTAAIDLDAPPAQGKPEKPGKPVDPGRPDDGPGKAPAADPPKGPDPEHTPGPPADHPTPPAHPDPPAPPKPVQGNNGNGNDNGRGVGNGKGNSSGKDDSPAAGSPGSNSSGKGPGRP